MLIKWIKLNNIRSYIDSTIQFPEGTTLLSGDIGSGKSTILLSIEFALFGISKGEVSGSSLLRKGAGQGEVELCFMIEQQEIIIKRVLKKKKDSISQENSYIIREGVKKDCAPTELKAIILELLGYPQDFLTKKNLMFRYTVYTPQEEMKRIIFESKEERLNTLRKVFGIDKYKRVRENVLLVEKKLKDQCKEISGYIVDLENKKKLFEEIDLELNEIKKTINPLVVQKTEQEKIIKQINEEIVAKRKIKEEFIEYKNKLINLDNELKTINSERESNNLQIKEYEKQISGIIIEKYDVDKKQEYETKIKDTEQTLIELREKKATQQEKYKNLIENKKQIELFIEQNKIEDKNDIILEIQNLESQISNKEELIKEINLKKEELIMHERNKAVLKDKIKNSNDILDRINKIEQCPTCFQTVDEKHKIDIEKKQKDFVKDYTSAIEMIDTKINSIKIKELENKLKVVEENEKKFNNLNLKIEKINIIENEIKSKKIQLENINITLNEFDQTKQNKLNEDIESLMLILQKTKQELSKIEQAIVMTRIKQEKESSMVRLIQKNNEYRNKVIIINEQKNNLAKQADKYQGIQEVMDKIESELRQTEKTYNEVRLLIVEKETKINEKTKETARINAEIQDKESKRKIIIKKKQYLDWINNSFINIISIIEKNILASLYNEFNSLFQEWFDILVEDELITARLDDEFSPIVQQNGYDVEIENMSGGEKTALALAYRLALNKVINEITSEINTNDLLILDEPTDGFSEQQLDKIRDVLEKLAMKQLIIVSHENKIESFVDNVINITKQEHISKVGI